MALQSAGSLTYLSMFTLCSNKLLGSFVGPYSAYFVQLKAPAAVISSWHEPTSHVLLFGAGKHPLQRN